MRRIERHAGIGALAVALLALFVAIGGIAGALPGTQRATRDLKVVQQTATTGAVPIGDAGGVAARCQGKNVAVGGGFASQGSYARVDGIRPQMRDGKPIGWHVFIGNDSMATAHFEVEALCARTK